MTYLYVYLCVGLLVVAGFLVCAIKLGMLEAIKMDLAYEPRFSGCLILLVLTVMFLLLLVCVLIAWPAVVAPLSKKKS